MVGVRVAVEDSTEDDGEGYGGETAGAGVAT